MTIMMMMLMVVIILSHIIFRNCGTTVCTEKRQGSSPFVLQSMDDDVQCNDNNISDHKNGAVYE